MGIRWGADITFRGVSPCFMPLKSVTYSQWNDRPTVAFPLAQLTHRSLTDTDTRLFCLMTWAQRWE